MVDHMKLKFYKVINCIFSRSKAANSELVGLANKDNIAEVRTCLGLHSIRSFVCTRRAKFMDSLLDTAPRALIAVYYANCVAM